MRRVGECAQKERNDRTIRITFDVGSGIYLGTFSGVAYTGYMTIVAS